MDLKLEFFMELLNTLFKIKKVDRIDRAISAGLDYPGISPYIVFSKIQRAKYTSASDEDALRLIS